MLLKLIGNHCINYIETNPCCNYLHHLSRDNFENAPSQWVTTLQRRLELAGRIHETIPAECRVNAKSLRFHTTILQEFCQNQVFTCIKPFQASVLCDELIIEML